MDSTSSSNLIQIVLLGILLVGSGFFSASETALMSLSKIRIRYMKEEGVKGAKLVEEVKERLINIFKDSKRYYGRW